MFFLPNKNNYFQKKSYFLELGGLAAPQTPLLYRGASPPGPPALNFTEHDPQITPN